MRVEGGRSDLVRDERWRRDVQTESVGAREEKGEAEGEEEEGGGEEVGWVGVGVEEGEAGRAAVVAGVSTAVMGGC